MLELSFIFYILVQKDLYNILLIFSEEMIQVKRKIPWNSAEAVLYLLHMRFQGQ